MPALQVRLGEDEYAKCKEAAKLAGLSVSEWVRVRLFGEQPSRVPNSRPHPPRVSVNAQGVIVAPAREVALPPSRRSRRVPPADILSSGPVDVLGALKVAAKACEFIPDDAALNALPPDPDELSADLEALLPTSAEMSVIVGEDYLNIPDDAPMVLPGPDVVSVGGEGPNFVVFSKPEPKLSLRPVFKRAATCTSDKCERLQTATCDACKYANAEWSANFADPEPVAPMPWQTGQRSIACITSKCARLGVPACDPCRRFNAEIEF